MCEKDQKASMDTVLYIRYLEIGNWGGWRLAWILMYWCAAGVCLQRTAHSRGKRNDFWYTRTLSNNFLRYSVFKRQKLPTSRAESSLNFGPSQWTSPFGGCLGNPLDLTIQKDEHGLQTANMAWLRERFLLQIWGREQSAVWEESGGQTDNSRLNIASRLTWLWEKQEQSENRGESKRERKKEHG